MSPADSLPQDKLPSLSPEGAAAGPFLVWDSPPLCYLRELPPLPTKVLGEDMSSLAGLPRQIGDNEWVPCEGEKYPVLG